MEVKLLGAKKRNIPVWLLFKFVILRRELTETDMLLYFYNQFGPGGRGRVPLQHSPILHIFIYFLPLPLQSDRLGLNQSCFLEHFGTERLFKNYTWMRTCFNHQLHYTFVCFSFRQTLLIDCCIKSCYFVSRRSDRSHLSFVLTPWAGPSIK